MTTKKSRKLYFSTGETNVIQTLMEIYSCLIAGLSYKDIKTIIEERDNNIKRVEELEERLDNKEKVNKQLREDIGKLVMNNPS